MRASCSRAAKSLHSRRQAKNMSRTAGPTEDSWKSSTCLTWSPPRSRRSQASKRAKAGLLLRRSPVATRRMTVAAARSWSPATRMSTKATTRGSGSPAQPPRSRVSTADARSRAVSRRPAGSPSSPPPPRSSKSREASTTQTRKAESKTPTEQVTAPANRCLASSTRDRASTGPCCACSPWKASSRAMYTSLQTAQASSPPQAPVLSNLARLSSEGKRCPSPGLHAGARADGTRRSSAA
mmetsp:Transcript_12146/g.35163  ORF Transcript_12146/g.35163 Transcript_12146/m.35163 type:complete len:239 (+) Transcript_12146:940-1656(+)